MNNIIETHIKQEITVIKAGLQVADHYSLMLLFFCTASTGFIFCRWKKVPVVSTVLLCMSETKTLTFLQSDLKCGLKTSQFVCNTAGHPLQLPHKFQYGTSSSATATVLAHNSTTYQRGFSSTPKNIRTNINHSKVAHVAPLSCCDNLYDNVASMQPLAIMKGMLLQLKSA